MREQVLETAEPREANLCTGETWGNLETAGSGEIVRVQRAERERSLKTVESGEVGFVQGEQGRLETVVLIWGDSSVKWKPGQSENRGSGGEGSGWDYGGG